MSSCKALLKLSSVWQTQRLSNPWFYSMFYDRRDLANTNIATCLGKREHMTKMEPYKQFPTFVETDFERIQKVRIGTNDKVLKAIIKTTWNSK